MLGPKSPSQDTRGVNTPMDETCTFLSYNSTGLNTVKTKWIRDLIDVTKSDFISVQEHFKKTKSIEKFFSDEFPNSSSFIVPGHRDPGQELGRAKRRPSYA